MRLLLWVLQLTALIMVIGGCSRVQGRERVKELTAYYVQFGVETLTPVTSANIQERGSRCAILSSKDVVKIRKVLHDALKPASQKFSDARVRVKLVEEFSEGERLLAIVESEGEVRFPDGTEGQISRRGLNTLKKVIESQCWR